MNGWRPRCLLPALIFPVLLLSGCAAELVFVGDPALQASLADTDAFEATIRRAAQDASLRAEVIWPDAGNLDTMSVETVLAEHDATVVVLSPYLSLLASEIAAGFPDRRFVGFYGRQEQENVLWVEFDATDAMTEAGEVLAEWVFAAPERDATVLLDAGSRTIENEAEALEAGYEKAAGVPLQVERFVRGLTRDEVRSRMQGIPRDGGHALVVLLGRASGWVYESIRDDDVVTGYRNAPLLETDARALFTVRDDLAAGVAAALESPDDASRVVVPAVLELGREAQRDAPGSR